MKRPLRIAVIALAVGAAAAQLIRPEMDNPPVNPSGSLWNDPNVDPRVAGLLRQACADCHSHETVWPWYAKITPVSWMVARHVRDGRAKLNFSDWSGATSDQLEEIYSSVSKDKMPMASYLLMHPAARLSPANRKILLTWADSKVGASR